MCLSWCVFGADVNVTSGMYLLNGRCHTLRPLRSTEETGLTKGYSITLRHTSPVTSQQPWNIFVHQPSDVWTGNIVVFHVARS